MIRRILKYLIVGVVVSFYFFPFEFTFLPGINTKMMLAAMGLVFAGLGLAKKRSLDVPRSVMWMAVFGGLISIIGLVSIVYNGTSDTAYSRYIVSLSVWLSAAFTVCSIISFFHEKVTLKRVCNYLIGVSFAQCVLALMIDNIPAFKQLVDTYVQQGQVVLDEMERMYGIGASLDVAGSRFAACLIMIATFLLEDTKNVARSVVYTILFLFISVVGNMIARTTTVGIAISLLYVAYRIAKGNVNLQISSQFLKIATVCSLIVGGLVAFSAIQYNTNAVFREHLRFAFEGFFSLAETGEWDVSSNEALKSMVVFPETMKTWVIGDGYFENPRGDINYVGDTTTRGFYMGTDIGYLRFIFYFGVIGLLAFCAFIAFLALSCAKQKPKYAFLFILIAICNYVVWLKVATDLVLVFCVLTCAIAMEEDEHQEEDEEIEDQYES